jgi:tripartite-type tricarboxylate transporter receptor subunit TctC
VRASLAGTASTRSRRGDLRDEPFLIAAFAFAGAALAAPALAQPAAVPCPTANLLYWQAFPPGGESDLSARHQQLVLKKKCPAIETVIQYKAGAGGGLMWAQMNTLPADGLNVGRHQPAAHRAAADGGNVAYKTEDVTPVFWFHYTPDILVVGENEPDQDLRPTSSRRRRPTRARSTSAARASTRPTTRRTSGWTRRSRSRRPTCRTRAPATSRSRCSAATSTAR